MATDIRTAALSDGRTLLSDLMRVPALAGARTSPPGADLERPVSAIALADADAPEEPDCLLVVAGAPPETPPRGCIGVVARSAPAAPIGVPVILLPPGVPWGAVIAQLSAAVAGGSGT